MIIYNYDLHNQTEEKIFKEHKRRVHNCFISSGHSESYINANVTNVDSTIYGTLKHHNINNALNLAKLIFDGTNDIFYDVESDLFKINNLSRNFDDIYSYLNKNIGYLKVFFMTVRGLCPFLTLIPTLSYQCKTNPIETIKKILNTYSDMDLFVFLLKSLHLHTDMQQSIINYALQTKENFILFLQGAAYSQDAKQQLWEIFSLGLDNTTLKDSLLSFITDYCKYYSQLYTSYNLNHLL